MNKDDIYQTFTKVDVPEIEEETIDEEKVLLSRTWGFWETYEQKVKSSQTDWGVLIKKIFSFKDIISFWQFWNSYPGSNFSEVFFNGEHLK
jgi:hypothetical protein